MQLKRFVKKYVDPNAVVRLWRQIPGGHEMISAPNPTGKASDSVAMAWALTDGGSWMHSYRRHRVVNVFNCDVYGEFSDAINICIVDDLRDWGD